MRDTFAQAFYDEARVNPKLFLVVADISPASKISNFKQEFPTRFIDVGVSEQTMIGLAAGLALRGYKPFAYTIANFSIYRPFEQVRNDLCYQNLPVTVVGMGAGITYSPLGAYVSGDLNKGNMGAMTAQAGVQGVIFPTTAVKDGSTWKATVDISKLMSAAGGGNGPKVVSGGKIPVTY